MGHFNTGLIFKCWIWRVYGQNMVRIWWKYGPFSSLWYSTIMFPRVFLVFSSSFWSFWDDQQISSCNWLMFWASEAGGLRPGGGPSTLGSSDAGDHDSSEVDRFEAWRSREIHGPMDVQFPMVGSWRCLHVSPTFQSVTGQMMRPGMPNRPLCFSKSVPVFFDARDVTRAAFPEERRPAPNLSGLVKEVFGLPLDKTCQVAMDGHGPWAMGWNLGCDNAAEAGYMDWMR